MTRHDDNLPGGPLLWGGPLGAALLIGAGAWLMLAEYHPMSLAVLVAGYFLAYAGFRTILFLDGNRFTPRRLQVGMNWALTGFNANTDEFDIGPVRVYFLLLAILSAGLFLRPIVKGVLS